MNLPNDISGRHIVVTGANTGIGRYAAVDLAVRGADVTLACRSRERTEPVLEEIKQKAGRDAAFLHLDLASFDSVRAAAEELLATDKPITVLINNAGLLRQFGTTADGFELAFGTMHLGHFLFTQLLLDRIIASAPSRIINVTSDSHLRASGIDEEAVQKATSSSDGGAEYAMSKLANVVYTQELVRRLEGTGVTTYTMHPGVIATDIWRNFSAPEREELEKRLASCEEGALTLVHAAISPDVAGHTGLYYENCEVRPANPVATPELGEWLWTTSEKWTQPVRG